MRHHHNPLGPKWLQPTPPQKPHLRPTWLVIFVLTVVTVIGIGCIALLAMEGSLQHQLGEQAATTTPTALRFDELLGGRTARVGRGQVNQIAYAPDNQTLAVASSIGVWLYHLNPPDHGRLLPTPEATKSVDWSPDGHLLVGGTIGTIFVWSISDGRIVQTIELPENMALYSRVQWSPDGVFIAASVLVVGRAETRIWSPVTGQLIHLFSHTHINEGLNWSPNSQSLAITVGNEVQIWNVATEQMLSMLHGRASSIYQVAWSPDGNKLATGSLDEVPALNETVHIWAASERRLLTTIHAHAGALTDLAWSPDGKRIVTSGLLDPVAYVWSADDGHLVATLLGHLHEVDSVSWSPDGTQIATSSSVDSDIRIWSARDGHQMQHLSEHMPL